jgi:hypothetical protein
MNYGDDNENQQPMDFICDDEPPAHASRQKRRSTTNFDYGDRPNSQQSDKAKQQELVTKFTRHKLGDPLAIEPPRWLIRDLIYERQVGVFYAPTGTYKTFVVIGLGGMKVHSMEWLGRRLKPCNVIYMAGEGFAMFGLRRLAWFKLHGMEPIDDGFEVIGCTVNLMEDDEVDAFIESAGDMPSLGLVALDTMSTSVPGEDENSSMVMTKAVASAIKIGRALNCAVMLIHHPGKEEERGMRGHSSLGGNTDFVLRGQKIEDGNKVTVAVVKQKDGEAGKVVTFSVHKVPLGIYDDDGVERTSLAVQPCETPQEVIQRQSDLSNVVSVMKLDEEPSISSVAQRLIDYKLVDCKKRGAEMRVTAAVPIEWTPVDWFGKLAEVRRVPAEKTGMRHKLVLRLAELDPANHAAP